MPPAVPAVPPLLPVAALIVASLLWAGAFVAMKYAVAIFDPMVVVFGRMALAALVLLPIAARMHPHQDRRPGDLRLLLFMSLGEPCLYFVFEANALRLTTASQAGMIAATLPLMIDAAAVVFLGERVSRRTVAGFVLALAGVAWLSASGQPSEAAPNPVLGNALEVLAMAAATCYIVTAKHLSARYSPLYITAFMAGVGTLFFLPTLALPGTELPRSFPPLAVASVVFLGLGVTLGAYLCYNYGVKYLPASQAGAFMNLIPVVVVFLGWWLLDEVFTPQQFAASALVLCGVLLCREAPAAPAAIPPGGPKP